MRNNYCFAQELNTIKLSASMTRMLLVLGEGELEIVNQGRFGLNSSFSQEAEVEGQHSKPRIGLVKAQALKSVKCRMHAKTLAQLPVFFSAVFFLSVFFFIRPAWANMEFKRAMPMKAATAAEQQDQKLKDVASLYEKQFLRELVKSMRSTVTESGLVKVNPAEKMYRENLDHDYVEKWGDKGGIGLHKIIYDQLAQKYGPKKLESLGPKGPLPLNPQPNSKSN